METTISLRRTAALLALVSVGALAFVACSSSDDNAAPTSPLGGAGGGGGSGGSGGADASGGTGGTDAGDDASGDATDAAADVSPTWDGGGCDPYPATTPEEYLNECTGTGVTCQPYDNSTLTALLPDGGVPALP